MGFFDCIEEEVDEVLTTIRDQSSIESASAVLHQSLPEVGSVIRFGHYPQNEDGGDSTPIDWRVLEVRGNRVLLLSEYGLDCREYNQSCVDVTWETCSVRKWLNEQFLNSAFSSEERVKLIETTVAAGKNPKYDTDPGNDTQDKVFLLSIAEAEKYFSSNKDRACVSTAYAYAQYPFSDDYNTLCDKLACWWWLRSPGVTQHLAAHVRMFGSVSYDGDFSGHCDGCVRPALWINIDS